MAREKCGFLAVPRTAPVQLTHYVYTAHVLEIGMQTLVCETKVESRAALRDLIFAAAEQIRNHPDIVASATQSLLMRGENCIATGGGHFEQLL